METKEYTKAEMLKEKEKEKGKPIKKKWFKHKEKEIYKNRLDIFKEFKDFEEI